jgi:hypothetical protein
MTNKQHVCAWALLMGGLAGSTAQAYQASANVTFSWGLSSFPALASSAAGPVPAQASGGVKGWTSSGSGPIGVGGGNALSVMSNTTQFDLLTGIANAWNSQTYQNSNFMAADGSQCTGGLNTFVPSAQGPYQCINSAFSVVLGPIDDAGPSASASGTLAINDADPNDGLQNGTLTGTLTVVSTSDEVDARSASGYNIRSADGSPFGNAFYGVSTSATITLNLTGTFSATAWEITGGTTNLRDPAFQAICNPLNATLCTVSVQAGGFGNDGSSLNPGGWDLDGGGTGTTMGQVLVNVINPAAAPVSLGGVLASVTVDGGGNISTTAGEARSGLGSSSCAPATLNWDVGNNRISCGTLTITRVSFAGQVAAGDTVPDQFTFTDQVDVARSTVVQSNTVTITGIDSPATVSITGGEYSVGCTGTFTGADGPVNNNDTICVRQTSSADFSTTTDATLSIGGVTDAFSVTTLQADRTPDAFAFTDVSNVPLSTEQTSNTVTITGIDDGTDISVSGAASSEYSVGCTGTFTSTAGTIDNGETVCVRHTSAAAGNTAVNTTLTVGTASDTFTSTTLTPDSTPDAFAFTDQTGVATSTLITSNTVTIAGINVPANITVTGTGGQYSIGCTGTFTTAAGTISNGQTVCVRHTSAATGGSNVDTTLTVGGVADVFRSTTVANDSTPDDFDFVDQVDVDQDVLVVSNAVTISGINVAAPISVVNGQYSVGCTGTFINTPGTIANGQTVCVRHTSSASASGEVITTLTIGGVARTFLSRTGLAQPGTSAMDPWTLGALLGLLGLAGRRRRLAA